MIRAFSFSFSYSYLWHFPLSLRCVLGVSGVLRAFPFPSSSSGCCVLLMLIHTTYILSIIFSKRALLVGPWFFSLFSVLFGSVSVMPSAETLGFLASFRSKRGRSSPSRSPSRRYKRRRRHRRCLCKKQIHCPQSRPATLHKELPSNSTTRAPCD